jgi:hypothetical protein
MIQLVGQNCVLCQKRIDSILEGEFCSVCSCPVHTACRKGGSMDSQFCPGCGVHAAMADTLRKNRETEVAAQERDVRGYHMTTGPARVILGVLFMIGSFVAGVFALLLAHLGCILYVGLAALFALGCHLIATGTAQLDLLRRQKTSPPGDSKSQ